MTYQHPMSGATQEVAEREKAKRRILESAGWRPVKLVDVTAHDSVSVEVIAVPVCVSPVSPVKRKPGRPKKAAQ